LEQALVPQISLSAPSPTPSTQAPTTNLALSYLQDLQAETASSARELLPFLGSPLKGESPKRSRSSASREAASRWTRLALSPGIELHISDTVAFPPPGPPRTAWLKHLAERLNDQLDGETTT
jgi:hypothetical protein